MNYQKQPPEVVMEILKEKSVQCAEFSYYAWPQTFSNTACAGGGMGGQTISVSTVEAYVCGGVGPTVYLCSGMFFFDEEEFEPFKKVRRWYRV